MVELALSKTWCVCVYSKLADLEITSVRMREDTRPFHGLLATGSVLREWSTCLECFR